MPRTRASQSTQLRAKKVSQRLLTVTSLGPQLTTPDRNVPSTSNEHSYNNSKSPVAHLLNATSRTSLARILHRWTVPRENERAILDLARTVLKSVVVPELATRLYRPTLSCLRRHIEGVARVVSVWRLMMSPCVSSACCLRVVSHPDWLITTSA